MSNDIQAQIVSAEQHIVNLRNSVAKRANLIKWGLGTAVVIVIAPLAVTGLIGALALAGIGVVGLVAINGFPVLATRLANAKAEALIVEANRHLAALKAEAAKNPIETLQNEQRQKHKELAKELRSIQEFDAEVENLRTTIEGVGLTSPLAKRKGDEALRAMDLKLRYRRLMYTRAQDAVSLGDAKVEEAEALWRVAMAAQRADAASGEGKSDVFRKIMEDTAYESVATQVNMAIAGLRTSLLKDDVTEAEVLQLEQSRPDVLDVQAQVIKEGVHR